MIKRWDRFNENIFSGKEGYEIETQYKKYRSAYIQLVRDNIPQVEKIIDDVKECFISFQDDGLVKKYQFGGMYNPDKRKSAEQYFNTRPSPSLHDKPFLEPDKEIIKSISEFLMPKYWGEYKSRFMKIDIDFPFQESGWIGGKGIDLMDMLIESKNRLKSIGYDMEIYFWKFKFPTPSNHGYAPLEVRV